MRSVSSRVTVTLTFTAIVFLSTLWYFTRQKGEEKKREPSNHSGVGIDNNIGSIGTNHITPNTDGSGNRTDSSLRGNDRVSENSKNPFQLGRRESEKRLLGICPGDFSCTDKKCDLILDDVHQAEEIYASQISALRREGDDLAHKLALVKLGEKEYLTKDQYVEHEGWIITESDNAMLISMKRHLIELHNQIEAVTDDFYSHVDKAVLTTYKGDGDAEIQRRKEIATDFVRQALSLDTQDEFECSLLAESIVNLEKRRGQLLPKEKLQELVSWTYSLIKKMEETNTKYKALLAETVNKKNASGDLTFANSIYTQKFKDGRIVLFKPCDSDALDSYETKIRQLDIERVQAMNLVLAKWGIVRK